MRRAPGRRRQARYRVVSRLGRARPGFHRHFGRGLIMTTQPYLKPLPLKEPGNEPLWTALAQHRFVVPKCTECGAWNWVPYPACRECFSEKLEWTEISGNGTLFTYTIVHRGLGAFNAEV